MKVSRRRAFLEAFQQTGSITKAAELAGVERGMHYRWLKKKGYAEDFARAARLAGDRLVDEVVRRGFEGYLEPVYWHGKTVGAVRRYSDGLAIRHLAAIRPEYRERSSVQHSGPGGGPIPIDLDLDQRIADELARLAAARAVDNIPGKPQAPAEASPPL